MQVRDAVAAGAADAAEVGRRTGAGTDCGQCRPLLDRLILALATWPADGGGNDAGKFSDHRAPQ